MSNSLNRVLLIGNLGKDPEVKSTNHENKEIVLLNLATSENWKNKATGEKKEKTEWHRIVIFKEGLVYIAKTYLKKGSKVYLEGQLQTRRWTDQNGTEKFTTEIVLQGFHSNLILLDKKGQNNFQSDTDNDSSVSEEILDDEIPF
ncbi:MAG: single-stranded DNA-binding protein [Rickettsia sp.]|nr:single-stranded DNA-binding protein [Rickettsia sp.]